MCLLFVGTDVETSFFDRRNITDPGGISPIRVVWQALPTGAFIEGGILLGFLT